MPLCWLLACCLEQRRRQGLGQGQGLLMWARRFQIFLETCLFAPGGRSGLKLKLKPRLKLKLKLRPKPKLRLKGALSPCPGPRLRYLHLPHRARGWGWG